MAHPTSLQHLILQSPVLSERNGEIGERSLCLEEKSTHNLAANVVLYTHEHEESSREQAVNDVSE